MIISPTKALEEGWVFGEDICSDSLQPNGIDFKIERVFTLVGNEFELNKNAKKNRTTLEIFPGKNNNFKLCANNQYDILTNLQVKLPSDIAATIIIRSTLARNGLQLVSGFWDSAYSGPCGCVLHIPTGADAYIEQGSRIGQIIFHNAQSAFNYKGQYQGQTGYWKEEIK